MTGYLVLNLSQLIGDEAISDDEIKEYLNAYSCPMNKDIEVFLHQKAVEFQKQGISRTYLVLASYKKEYVLCGYFTLANKVLCVDKWENLDLSKSWRKRMNKFASFDRKAQRYTLPIPLIGQLGKNYTNGYNTLISGDELLTLALEKIGVIQDLIGGKVVFVECEPKDRLIEFYSRNGFVWFADRHLDRDETDIDGERLAQMIRYM